MKFLFLAFIDSAVKSKHNENHTWLLSTVLFIIQSLNECSIITNIACPCTACVRYMSSLRACPLASILMALCWCTVASNSPNGLQNK